MMIITAILFIANAANAQFGFPELVDIKTYKQFDKSAQGSELKIALQVDIDETWHINSNNPKDDFLIPTDIEIKSDDGLILTNVVYPRAEDLMFSFSENQCRAARGLTGPRAPLGPFIPSGLPEPDESWRTVSVDDLCRFWSHPARYFLNHRLGIHLEEADAVIEEKEPFL